MNNPQHRNSIGDPLIAIILFCLFGMDAVYFTIRFLVEGLEQVTNSAALNNLHYYLFSVSASAILFWGVIMLCAAGLAALALRSEGVLQQAWPKAPFTLETLRLTTLVFVIDCVMSLLIMRVMALFSPDKSVDMIKPGYEYQVSWSMFPADLFTTVFAAPLAEEFLFRGALFSALIARGSGPVVAILVSSALFAFGHGQYEWQGLVLVFFGGTVLGFLRWYTGGLIAPLICHAAYNFWVTSSNYWATLSS